MNTLAKLLAALVVAALAVAVVPASPQAEIEAGTEQVPPTKRRALLRWLAAGTFRATYVAEPEVHPSAGPHGGNVRTWFNSILVEDLRAGRTTFRKGAAVVKELYFSGVDRPTGYAVMVKTRRNSGDRGEGWVWLESFDGTADGAIYGRGVALCANCHGAGTDYLLSPFRP